jgi:hypothetical protein
MSKLPNNQSSSYRKQKATAADLSLFEKLDTIPAVLSVCMLSSVSSHLTRKISDFNLTYFFLVGNVVLALFSGFYKSKDRIPKSYYRHVYLTAIRTLTRRTSVRQQQYVFSI